METVEVRENKQRYPRLCSRLLKVSHPTRSSWKCFAGTWAAVSPNGTRRPETAFKSPTPLGWRKIPCRLRSLREPTLRRVTFRWKLCNEVFIEKLTIRAAQPVGSPLFRGDPKGHHRDHKLPPPHPIPSRVNATHTIALFLWGPL
jgi:hypothetical protein